ncbi:chitin deacetylase [Magnaporthiopsis poae ATCC 64411]|uniref:Chitin deacetylase n=1 Tax=Magnaporthiopsis poae (strain ATCC 64411 / 73-15) TaxID=644358 RepID=A0A0C4DUN0_MAGP6|nr:chitin deacetylase [Magnaporthiopsis poae ATCC 64411]
MLFSVASLVLLAAEVAPAWAHPAPNPIEMIRRAPNPGVVYTKCARPNTLALAFDDGPYQYTQRLVDILNAAGAKATFFFTGTLYGCIYNQASAVRNAYNSGHQISSHTWTHANLGNLQGNAITQEMQRLEQAFVNIFGKKPAYMRPPYLATGGQVLNTMRSLGYKVITNDIDAGDWNGKSPQQSQSEFTRAGAGGNGHIPLMHETYQGTVEVLVPWLINWAKQNNLALVTVADCLGDSGGAYQPGNFQGNGQNRC